MLSSSKLAFVMVQNKASTTKRFTSAATECPEEREMREIVEVCRAAGKTSKVIFENCYLTDEEKKILCEIA